MLRLLSVVGAMKASVVWRCKVMSQMILEWIVCCLARLDDTSYNLPEECLELFRGTHPLARAPRGQVWIANLNLNLRRPRGRGGTGATREGRCPSPSPSPRCSSSSFPGLLILTNWFCFIFLIVYLIIVKWYPSKTANLFFSRKYRNVPM